MAIITTHFEKRLYERIIVQKDQNVGFEHEIMKYTIIGNYQIPNEIKNNILSTVDIIEKTKFQNNKSFGVKIAYVPIDKNKVIYRENSIIKEINPLVFVDESTNSNGNILFAIIRNNTLTTVYFGKNYIPQTKEKLNVDYIINDVTKYKISTLSLNSLPTPR